MSNDTKPQTPRPQTRIAVGLILNKSRPLEYIYQLLQASKGRSMVPRSGAVPANLYTYNHHAGSGVAAHPTSPSSPDVNKSKSKSN